MLKYYLLQLVATVLAFAAFLYLMVRGKFFSKTYQKIKTFSAKTWLAIGIIAISLLTILVAANPYPIHFAMPPTMHSQAPGEHPPSIPVPAIWNFFSSYNDFEQIDDIGADPNAVPAPITRTENQLVTFDITAKEVLAEVADDITFNYWTYNGQVPGPMLRVKEGDQVQINFTNDPSSIHSHNIDLHSVTGPGGGAAVTNAKPGESKSFQWKALNPGLYIYHCATPNVSTHNSHGQYGLILVEPKEGLPPVDKEFYVVQGELYTSGDIGKKGLVPFDSQALLDGIPNYVTFNGRIEKTPRMKAQVGETVRMYVGNGGVNLISSFHVIGEIFDKVYPEGAIGSEIHKNIQTTAVLPGGASIVEFKLEVPGKYTLVDHALARMNKGAWAVLEVEGEPNEEVFRALTK